ncbi:aldolase/citrate lyase family protein [Variovorax sp. PCZ-1]|uniref:HpcH/HpaI aldolase/citrate lyase family protein n=1 Tax=Variovorax sp. PCZ-1 TaxID=2835533 RepID=UPI001BD0BCE7|nr:aldolase/citrate lyase family protein [Variovorax sp. PCZ-1]MBS7807108.1 CoA ester lyase [Variovorax sp. PCZ-1]
MTHPREVLLGSQAASFQLPVVDHYCGVEARMKKSLALQAELIEEFGACVMDVTLDCEDGAPAGQELEHANLVLKVLLDGIEPAQSAINNVAPRIGVRVHAIDHAAFANDVRIIVGGAAKHLAYVMIPKVERAADIDVATKAIDAAGGAKLPLHVLIESSAAVSKAFEIAAHPRVQSISFGLMDFVSSHGGAIPASAMTAQGQFTHPLVTRAKLEIAAACHAHGKVPSHCVVTEFADTAKMQAAATQASQQLGYTRMWSIHPSQVRPILQAFAPDAQEIDDATQIVSLGAENAWAPASFNGQLHDRASYRYYYQLLERAHRTGAALSNQVLAWFDHPSQPATLK